MTGKPLRRRAFEIKAEVEFVNADEAKKLVAVEGYAVLDVRDKTQFERAHIKNCYHVPLFVENTDNDLGISFLLYLSCFLLQCPTLVEITDYCLRICS